MDWEWIGTDWNESIWIKKQAGACDAPDTPKYPALHHAIYPASISPAAGQHVWIKAHDKFLEKCGFSFNSVTLDRMFQIR